MQKSFTFLVQSLPCLPLWRYAELELLLLLLYSTALFVQHFVASLQVLVITPIDFPALFLRSKIDALDSLNIYMTFLVSNFISYCLCEEHDYVLKFPVFYAFFF